MIKGDPIEPSRLELYCKQITMKYRKNKSNITEYKQKKNTGKETDRVYVDPVQRRARWKLVAVGARKKLNNGRRAAKLARRRSAETAKKLKKTQK
jgi:hypothetical protein